MGIFMNSVTVGLTKDLPNGRVMRSFVKGEDLVIWRSASGQLSSWLNRCPHRGMRLSHGFVRGESLACVYHGWHYDSKAACRYIPAHPDLDPPDTIKAKAFPSVDKGGLIWVNVDDVQDKIEVAEHLQPVRSLEFRCSAEHIKTVIPIFEFVSLGGERLKIRLQIKDRTTWILDTLCKALLVYIFVQDLPNEKCSLHVLSRDKQSSCKRKEISRFLEQLRHFAEPKYEVKAL